MVFSLNKTNINNIILSITISFASACSFRTYANESDTMQKNEHIKENFSIKQLDLLWEKRQDEPTKKEIATLLKSRHTIPNNFEIAWRIARLVYFGDNFLPQENFTNNDKINIFKYGYEAGEIARKINPKRVEGHYWYAINLGSYGLEKGIFTSLSNAKLGRDALIEAAKIDPSYHWGGPYRILGRYYQELPGGIISFGDKKIAEEYFHKAIKTSPKFRLNTMYLGILKEKIGDKNLALELFKKAEALPNVDGTTEENRYTKELAENIKSVQNK